MEGKKIATEVALVRRQRALTSCAALGFTLDNTPGVDQIKPRALGMKGQSVDFDALLAAQSSHDAKTEGQNAPTTKKSRRVDLSAIPEEGAYVAPQDDSDASSDTSSPKDFIKLDTVEGQDFKALNFNHRTRRKLRRAMEAAQIRKELLVRDHVRKYCAEKGIEPPSQLSTIAHPIHKRGQRIQENGSFETAKAERVRARLELTEFNKAARVLRKQAKEIALEAGLRVYAEMTGMIPPRGNAGNEQLVSQYGVGWHVPKEADPKDFLRPGDITLTA